ncbi:MAG: Gfo/Idh/MocA family protein [Devosiaceae bacterium]
MQNVAIIGAGIGEQHLAGYRALPDQFTVKAICDLNQDRARIVAGGDNTIAIYAETRTVLADKSIDIVDVCLPPHLHFDVSLSALRAGKHVICEKPLVRSLAEADVLRDACTDTQRKIFPVFQYRYGPGLDQLRALMHAGLAGKAYAASLETHWNRDSDYYAVAWRGTWTGESGGAVLGHAIHNHDLLTHILGPIKSLSAITTTRVNPIEVEDCASISFEMESGALATSSITLGAGDDTSRLRFVFEGFTATSGTEPYAPGEDTWTFTARSPTKQAHVDAILANLALQPSGYAGFFQSIAYSLDGHPASDVTLADGRRSLELVTAVYQAARTGNRVSLPLDKENALYAGWLPDRHLPNNQKLAH